MQAFVARHLDRVITVSQSSARDTDLFFKVPADRLTVVYNGIDTEIHRVNEEASWARDGLIMVANTDDRKRGVLYLLQALQLLREEGIKLTIVDDAERHSSYFLTGCLAVFPESRRKRPGPPHCITGSWNGTYAPTIRASVGWRKAC